MLTIDRPSTAEDNHTPKTSLFEVPFSQLNSEYAIFYRMLLEAEQKGDAKKSFFIRPDGTNPDYSPSITSFLCTDAALSIFDAGQQTLDNLKLAFPNEQQPGSASSMTNEKCLAEARAFFKYASIEGYRGSPHKL